MDIQANGKAYRNYTFGGIVKKINQGRPLRSHTFTNGSRCGFKMEASALTIRHIDFSLSNIPHTEAQVSEAYP